VVQAATAVAPATAAVVTRNARRVQLSCTLLTVSASCRYATGCTVGPNA
jgi:hypothetical protein